MDILYEFHDNLMKNVKTSFFRAMLDTINWDQRMLAIKGPRGSGKTTSMLQYIHARLNKPREQVLYLTADHYWFYTHNLVETADAFYKNGGRYLFIDEVHKYPHWSRELKNIYDGYPGLRIVFSSSSALDIYRGEADLSRRVITYELPGLSFREFLWATGNGHFQHYPWDDLVRNAPAIAQTVTEKIRPRPLFKKYLRYGYLPIFLDNTPDDVPLLLSQIINTIIETDLGYVEAYNAGTAFKVKKLLGVLAESVPFKPNIAALARKLDASRDSVYAWLTHLEKARLLNLLTAEGKGVSLLQKPEKLYLENTNLLFAMKPVPEIGTVRETFLLNQLINANLDVSLSKAGDFYTQHTHLEVGGKGKSGGQVKGEANYIIAADDIETAFGNKIPLWLFGFLS
jgi:predicted AAA+ superfamily ATPase